MFEERFGFWTKSYTSNNAMAVNTGAYCPPFYMHTCIHVHVICTCILLCVYMYM